MLNDPTSKHACEFEIVFCCFFFLVFPWLFTYWMTNWETRKIKGYEWRQAKKKFTKRCPGNKGILWRISLGLTSKVFRVCKQFCDVYQYCSSPPETLRGFSPQSRISLNLWKKEVVYKWKEPTFHFCNIILRLEVLVSSIDPLNIWSPCHLISLLAQYQLCMMASCETQG